MQRHVSYENKKNDRVPEMVHLSSCLFRCTTIFFITMHQLNLMESHYVVSGFALRVQLYPKNLMATNKTSFIMKKCSNRIETESKDFSENNATFALFKLQTF